mmetsp:Transcript_39359/g.29070  ORF Transcript_39359/g.29070 Transcript_39359/m.29070 type:complete len:90 (+) Transcript_39359:147-416(+)
MFKSKLKGSFSIRSFKTNEYVDNNQSIVRLSEKCVSTLERQESFFRNQFDILFELQEQIGEGYCATVNKCMEKKSKEIYAVKIMRNDDE